ncbi:immune-induced peptide 14-like [Drosophila miranda]|uniref:immune-induced peptide 14-like n=1 Tax=Drosophila miranda TaxID=7229 RepID=UPI00143F9512|nr:immune-induced peptide 14-like [Drosophila miranda]
MNCLKICGFVCALIAAFTTAETATQLLNAGGHTLIQMGPYSVHTQKLNGTNEITQINST